MAEERDAQESPYQSVILDREPVELYKILKFEGLAMSGAEAKQLIDQGLVSVNDQVELRRRRKILNHDLIELGNVRLKMVLPPDG